MSRIKEIIAIFSQNEVPSSVAKKIHLWMLRNEKKPGMDEALSLLWKQSGEETANEDVSDAFDRFCLRAGIERDKAEKEVRRKGVFLFRPTWRATAAMVAWCISLVSMYWFASERSNEGYVEEVYASYGEMKELRLPDGSVVHLNAGSTLLYPGRFRKDVRTVYLFGEAAFEVRSDSLHPFTVKAGAVDVTAKGTRFNVCAYPNQRKVTAALAEGKIDVSCGKTEKSFRLAPGQKLVYDDARSTASLEEVEIADITAWQEEQFIFHGATLFEIFEAMERKYNLTVDYERYLFEDDKYNIRFKSKITPQEMMDILKQVVGDMEYEFSHTNTIPRITVTRD